VRDGLFAPSICTHTQIPTATTQTPIQPPPSRTRTQDTLQLELQIAGDLRDMEAEAARMQAQIDDGRGTKRDTLSEIVEVERQVCVCVRACACV